MTAVNLADAKPQGYEPDSTVSASEVPLARPSPAMCLQNAIDLQVDCVAACVKVDDISQILPCIDDITQRLARGERP